MNIARHNTRDESKSVCTSSSWSNYYIAGGASLGGAVEPITEIQFFFPGKYTELAEKWVEEEFSLIFAIFEEFTKFHSTFSVFHLEKSSNINRSKIWKVLLDVLSTQFFIVLTAGTRNSDFRFPFHH